MEENAVESVAGDWLDDAVVNRVGGLGGDQAGRRWVDGEEDRDEVPFIGLRDVEHSAQDRVRSRRGSNDLLADPPGALWSPKVGQRGWPRMERVRLVIES